MNGYYPPNTDLSFVKTTPEEERELFRRMRSGDISARDKIIENHLLFVAIEARKLAGGKLPDDEVVSAANLALMEAVTKDKFDASRGNRFTSYLRPFVRGAIKNLWREKFNAPLPLPDEDAETPLGLAREAENATVPTFEEEEFQKHLLAALEKSKEVLLPRERRLLREMYERGKSMAEVGRKLNLSRERIRQIHEVAIAKLRHAMQQMGVPAR